MSFFRAQLMNALRVLDNGNVAPARVTGSYAGAAGRPPCSYLDDAADNNGSGLSNIWTGCVDVLP